MTSKLFAVVDEANDIEVFSDFELHQANADDDEVIEFIASAQPDESRTFGGAFSLTTVTRIA